MPTTSINKSSDAASYYSGQHASVGVDTDDNRLYINPNGTRDPISRDRLSIVTTSATLTAADDGVTIVANSTTSVVMTLPPTAAGLKYTLTVKGVTSSGGHAFSPNASDKIMGDGFTSQDDKDAVCSAATDREGDSMTIVGDGLDGWIITSVVGTWARES